MEPFFLRDLGSASFLSYQQKGQHFTEDKTEELIDFIKVMRRASDKLEQDCTPSDS